MRLFLFIASLIIPLSTCDPFKGAQERRSLQQETAGHSDLFMTQYPQKPSLTATNPSDVKALKALYNATNGDYWNDNTGWLTGDPCQDLWHGLYCINGRVLNISLFNNNMSGSLPAELAKADALQVLNLAGNSIGGNIPTSILSLKSLQSLELESNSFTGQLPDVLSLPNLTTLDLGLNHLHGSLPTKWDTLPLQVLDLSTNQFTGSLPESVSDLKNLMFLNMAANNLTGTFPSSWGNLSNLQHLFLFSNQFNSPPIPSTWRGMKRMQEIQLDNMKGSVPSWIGSSWPQLQVLMLQDGSLTGKVPISLCSLKQLKQIGLSGNSLTGEIPTCLCELTTLEYIGFLKNNLTGSIPDCFGHLKNLVTIFLGFNNLTGTLPRSLGDLFLVTLDVSRNGLYGAIPSSFSNLTNITFNFYLFNNKFSTFEDGLEDFFNSIEACLLYSNPWSCPVPSYIPLECRAQCSQCNTGNKHDHCSLCVEDSSCGWCNEGPNCLEGSSSGPEAMYRCKSTDWTYGNSSQCPK